MAGKPTRRKGKAAARTTNGKKTMRGKAAARITSSGKKKRLSTARANASAGAARASSTARRKVATRKSPLGAKKKKPGSGATLNVQALQQQLQRTLTRHVQEEMKAFRKEIKQVAASIPDKKHEVKKAQGELEEIQQEIRQAREQLHEMCQLVTEASRVLEELRPATFAEERTRLAEEAEGPDSPPPGPGPVEASIEAVAIFEREQGSSPPLQGPGGSQPLFHE